DRRGQLQARRPLLDQALVLLLDARVELADAIILDLDDLAVDNFDARFLALLGADIALLLALLAAGDGAFLVLLVRGIFLFADLGRRGLLRAEKVIDLDRLVLGLLDVLLGDRDDWLDDLRTLVRRLRLRLQGRRRDRLERLQVRMPAADHAARVRATRC